MTAVVLLVVVAAVLLMAFGVQRSRARAGRRPAVRGRRSPRVDDVGYLAGVPEDVPSRHARGAHRAVAAGIDVRPVTVVR